MARWTNRSCWARGHRPNQQVQLIPIAIGNMCLAERVSDVPRATISTIATHRVAMVIEPKASPKLLNIRDLISHAILILT